MIWVYEFEDFPSDQWACYEEDKNSGAFEVYYHHAPLFKSNISSIEWSPPAMQTENKLKLVGLTMVVVRNLELGPVGSSVMLAVERNKEF